MQRRIMPVFALILWLASSILCVETIANPDEIDTFIQAKMKEIVF